MKKKLYFMISGIILILLMNAFTISASADETYEGIKYQFYSETGSYTVTGYSSTATEIEIPAFVNGIPVKAIGYGAFYGSDITKIVLPNTITSIVSQAFTSCKALESINFPSSLDSIGSEAFSLCHNLTSASIPGGVK